MINDYMKNVPEYYNGMYMKYDPYQVLYAKRRQMIEKFSHTNGDDGDDGYNIKIQSEVKTR